MQNVWQSCTFSDEIVSGDLKLHKFAVELHEFLSEKADPVYQDPELFLKNTFLTSQMKIVLKDSLLRLLNGTGTPVTIIDTGFGGGKTHTILLLHHIYNNKELGTKYITQYNFEKEYGISQIPNVQMITLDCRQIKKKTLWGEIADKMGKYNEVKQYDNDKQPITNIEIIKSFFTKPTLLLIDELPHYLLGADSTIVGKVSLAELTIRFIMDLISSISSTKNSCLILTLTAKQQLYEKYTESLSSKIKSIKDFQADDIYDKLKDGLSRQVQFTTPVSKEQIYDVIRTRLVKKINDKERSNTIKEFHRYFNEKGLITEPEYEDRILSAYPFHPFVIDTLYERVSTISKFNRTRGILRLLGLVLHNIHKKKKECTLVSTSDIDLTENEIKDELTSKIDIDLRQVIDSDCIRHAQNLDSHKHVKIIEKIARTVYLHSLIGYAKKSGIRPSNLKLAVSYPGMDPGLVDQALEEIEKEFWYIKAEGGEYYFDETPNINKIIHEHQREVTENEIRTKIEQAIKGLLPERSGISVIIWDESALEDTEKLKLFVVDYKKNIDEDNIAKSLMSNLLEHLPSGNIREKQNTIVFVYPDKDGIDSLKEKARILSAVERAKKDERIKMDKDYLTKLNARLEDSKGTLSSECFHVYCKVGYPSGPIPRLDVISALDTKYNNITDAAIDLLKKKGKLISDLGEDGLPEIKDKMKLSKIYDIFKIDKSKKFILAAEGILEAAKSGIIHEKFGYADELEEKEGKYVASIGHAVSVQWDGWLINKDLVYKEKETIEKHEEKRETPLEISFTYKIECESIKEIINTLGKLPILLLDGNVNRNLSAELKMEPDTFISLKSDLQNYQEVKSVLESIQSRVKGRGYLTIYSEKNLQNEFNKYEIKATQL